MRNTIPDGHEGYYWIRAKPNTEAARKMMSTNWQIGYTMRNRALTPSQRWSVCGINGTYPHGDDIEVGERIDQPQAHGLEGSGE